MSQERIKAKAGWRSLHMCMRLNISKALQQTCKLPNAVAITPIKCGFFFYGFQVRVVFLMRWCSNRTYFPTKQFQSSREADAKQKQENSMLRLAIPAFASVLQSGRLPFRLATTPGKLGWCNLELLHAHQGLTLYFPLICAFGKPSNFGGTLL